MLEPSLQSILISFDAVDDQIKIDHLAIISQKSEKPKVASGPFSNLSIGTVALPALLAACGGGNNVPVSQDIDFVNQLQGPAYINESLSKSYAWGRLVGNVYGDVDNDGDIDIITFPSNYTTPVPIPAIVWINQNGRFVPNDQAINAARDFQYVRDSIAGDFNNDGRMDFMLVDQGWELNNRNPAYFKGAAPILLEASDYGLTWKDSSQWLDTQGRTIDAFHHVGAASDFDQDGDLDIVIASFNGGLRLFVNDGDGTFTWRKELIDSAWSNQDPTYPASGAGWVKSATTGSMAIVAGQFRWWTQSDNIGGPAVLQFIDGKFTETQRLERPFADGIGRNYGAVDSYNVDVNGDGFEDIVMLWETENINGIDDGISDLSGRPGENRYQDWSNALFTVYQQQKDGSFVLTSTQSTNGKGGASQLYLKDLDQDGDIDFWQNSFGVHPARANEMIWLNNGTGYFANPAPFVLSGQNFPEWYLGQPIFLDANTDGRVDMVLLDTIYSKDSSFIIGEQISTWINQSNLEVWP